MSTPRILATFHPQAWINDYAIEIDGSFQIDVTDKILAMGRAKALALRDDREETDALVDHDHDGPFWVEVEQNIEQYFAQHPEPVEPASDAGVPTQTPIPPPAPALVILESPYAGDIETNLQYARACVKDALHRGEAPIASHLLYTQEGILDDHDPRERQLGIQAGLAWLAVAQRSVVYTDRGISPGMQQWIEAALRAGIPVEYRTLPSNAS